MTQEREVELYKLWSKEKFQQGGSEWRETLTPEEQCFISLHDAEYADAHSCRANASEYGICTICGAIIPGSHADYEIHGYDPYD